KRRWPFRAGASDAIGIVGDHRAASILPLAKAAFERAGTGIRVQVPVLTRITPGASQSVPNRGPFSRRQVPAFTVTEAWPLGLLRRLRKPPGSAPVALDFERMGRASMAIAAMIRELAGSRPATH
ncbi:MAG TPA: hypothetical protein VM580_07975, partial [Labilithrix sp.]|nr:hypothetical protein [Labilithrix sp.]